MAQYCPLPGQYLAVVRQDSLCREGVLKISTTASFSCVSSATLAFTLHSSHFERKLLIYNEYCGWRVEADSSPLFTTLHPDFFWGRNHFRNNVWSSMMTCFCLQWWPAPGFNDDQLQASMMAGLTAIRWREVKSGEECIVTLHPYKPLIYSWLYCICEEWRVFLKVALYSSNAAKLLRKMWEIAAKLLRKMWEIGQKVLRKMWEIAEKLLRKMWFFIRNPLIMSLFCKRG